MNKQKIKCSVGILTFNNEQTLGKALESVKEFSEIIICDGGSGDKTLEIAEQYNCKIIKQDQKFKNADGKLKDFGGAKNQMVDMATNDWVLVVDSDEYLSQGLVSKIREINLSDSKILYNILRKYVVDGEVIDLATTYPNYQIRLFNKAEGIRFIKKVHEKPDYNNSHQVKKIEKHFYVPLPLFKEFKKKNARYINIQLGMWNDISLARWLKITFFHLRASAAYLLRLILLQFKSGKKLPLKYELYRHYYNLTLIIKSISKIK